jgi:hypothetical protein
VAAGLGENENAATTFMNGAANDITGVPGPLATLTGDRDYWHVSAVAVANLSEAVSFELGASYTEGDSDSSFGALYSIEDETLSVAAGAYYTPVSQLTLGLEAGWVSGEASNTDGVAGTVDHYRDDESITVDFVSVFRF